MLVSHDPGDGFGDGAVVDRVREIVALARGGEVYVQLDVDLERLRPHLLLRQHAVDTDLAQSGNHDAIHKPDATPADTYLRREIRRPGGSTSIRQCSRAAGRSRIKHAAYEDSCDGWPGDFY